VKSAHALLFALTKTDDPLVHFVSGGFAKRIGSTGEKFQLKDHWLDLTLYCRAFPHAAMHHRIDRSAKPHIVFVTGAPVCDATLIKRRSSRITELLGKKSNDRDRRLISRVSHPKSRHDRSSGRVRVPANAPLMR